MLREYLYAIVVEAIAKMLLSLHVYSCGNMFCETHSSFQIKLDAQARHDTNGLWCRVCEACFVKAKKEDDGLHAGGRDLFDLELFHRSRVLRALP